MKYSWNKISGTNIRFVEHSCKAFSLKIVLLKSIGTKIIGTVYQQKNYNAMLWITNLNTTKYVVSLYPLWWMTRIGRKWQGNFGLSFLSGGNMIKWLGLIRYRWCCKTYAHWRKCKKRISESISDKYLYTYPSWR